MKYLSTLETIGEKFFGKLPALPAASRNALAELLPWVALVFGVLQIMAAVSLAMALARLQTAKSDIFTGDVAQPGDGFLLNETYLVIAIIVMLINAIILLVSFVKLKKFDLAGWRLLLLGIVINMLYTVFYVVLSQNANPRNLVGLLGSLVGFYLVFQVRGSFGRVKSKGA